MTPEVLAREVVEVFFSLSNHMPREKVEAIQAVAHEVGEDILEYTVEELVLKVHEKYREE